jgi:hypothetical protein
VVSIFIIDTEDYAGNFERHLCAYLTGQIGECEVGVEEQVRARVEISPQHLKWFSAHTIERRDGDDSCARPCAIWPTPGYFNDGMGNTYRVGDDLELVQARHTRAVVEWESVHPGEKLEREVGAFPSYQSVALFFNMDPPLEVRQLLEARAISWVPVRQFTPKPSITGFRLVREVVSYPVLYESKRKP